MIIIDNQSNQCYQCIAFWMWTICFRSPQMEPHPFKRSMSRAQWPEMTPGRALNCCSGDDELACSHAWPPKLCEYDCTKDIYQDSCCRRGGKKKNTLLSLPVPLLICGWHTQTHKKIDLFGGVVLVAFILAVTFKSVGTHLRNPITPVRRSIPPGELSLHWSLKY